jgi:chromosome segregation ATPase
MDDELRSEMRAGFERVHDRLEEVDRRFENVDKRCDEIKAELTGAIQALEATLEIALDRIANYWKRDAGHCTTRARMDSRLQNHEWRMKQLEKK